MSKTSKIILVTIIATCILLGLGYAAITNITLNIAGTASAAADSGNFKVRFTGTPTVSDSSYTTARITEEHEATIEVDGLTSAGQSVTATYEIKNESSDLSADLKVATTNSNTDYFKISSQLGKSSLIANESTTVLVTVELTKTPIDADVSATVGVNLTAMPVQPGEEGTSAGTNDYSETPTTVNEYGFYFDEAYIYVEDSGDRQIVILHEDGSAEGYYNNMLMDYAPPGTAIYTKETISGVGMTADILNSKQIYYNNAIFTLDETYMDKFDSLKLNQYGFYYGKPYTTYNLDNPEESITLIVNEDGSIEGYKNGVADGGIPKELLSYEKNKITLTIEDTYEVDGETKIDIITVELNVLCNGKIIEFDDKYFVLDLEFLEKYCLPEGYFYGVCVDELEDGEFVYAWQRQLPETFKAFDIYLTPEYGYVYVNEQWAIATFETDEITPSWYISVGKDKESYSQIPSEILGYPIYSMIGLFENCTNLKKAPAIPSSIEHMDKAFAGCTSLEGEIEINVVNLESYTDCFKGVDMSKITLTGTASKEIKNLLGSTGENYTPIP